MGYVAVWPEGGNFRSKAKEFSRQSDVRISTNDCTRNYKEMRCRL